jgi:hypothetical protein
MSDLPETVPCPRCERIMPVVARSEADGQICRLYAACGCGIRIDAAGQAERDPNGARADALASLRAAWKAARDMWRAFMAKREDEGAAPSPAAVVTVPQMQMELGLFAPLRAGNRGRRR